MDLLGPLSNLLPEVLGTAVVVWIVSKGYWSLRAQIQAVHARLGLALETLADHELRIRDLEGLRRRDVSRYIGEG